ncbi:MAG TPA: tripartite tricarboxylate transporter substrate binding protein [Burkholderiales bacterium]|nr:tripartite tricarboxylate transporter substrate binding protein [Burkholderiales bacterium]
MSTSGAAEFPERPLRIVVEFPAGGASDVVARRVGAKLRERIGQQVVVDNRAGAGGVIAHDHVAKSPADGYTLLLASTALAANKSLHRKLSYDPATDFAPVSLLADWGAILVVHPSVPAKTLTEFIHAAKARPGVMTYSTAGNGTWPHLATEMLNSRAGIKMVHVPYKGAVPALTDVIGGFIDAKIDSYVTAMPNIKSGRLRALGVTSAERMLQAPDIATIAEQGYPGYATAIWAGLMAPKNTPREVIAKLESNAAASVKDREVNARLIDDGVRPVGSSAADMDKLLKSELALWAKVIREIGIKPVE